MSLDSLKRDKYIAKVIDNNATNWDDESSENGAIQIKIEHLHHGFKEDQLMWALQDREDTSDIPEIDDLVWVWFEDEEFWKNPYYQNKVNLKDLHEHNEHVGSMESEYPDVKYRKYKNGIIIGVSSNEDTPEISIVHPEETEIFINKDGFLHYKDKNENTITIDENGIIVEDTNGNISTQNSDGIAVEDTNGNKVTSDSSGVIVEDVNGNKITTSSSGIKMEDSNGNVVEMKAGMVDINGKLTVNT